MDVVPVKCVGDRIISEVRVMFQLEDYPTLKELEDFVVEARCQGMRDEDVIRAIDHRSTTTVPYALVIEAGDWAFSNEAQGLS
jgi:hypothetical protein